jgi:hypothetical protein
MQEEAEAGNGTGGLDRGVDVDTEKETTRLLRGQDSNDDSFPMLIWKLFNTSILSNSSEVGS